MGNAYKRFAETLEATEVKNVLTVPAATTAIVKSIIVSNTNVASSDIIIAFSPEGVGTHFIVPEEALAANAFIDFLKDIGPLILEAGDILKATSSVDDVYVIASALLIDRT